MSMEAQYKTRSGRLFVKVQAEKEKDLFRQLATVQEVFDAETQCGCCNSENIRFQVRSVESMEFFEIICIACGAKFEFGQHKNGAGLFPKRRSERGDPLPNNGWKKWKAEFSGGRAEEKSGRRA
jgi:hypothetical protein